MRQAVITPVNILLETQKLAIASVVVAIVLLVHDPSRLTIQSLASLHSQLKPTEIIKICSRLIQPPQERQNANEKYVPLYLGPGPASQDLNSFSLKNLKPLSEIEPKEDSSIQWTGKIYYYTEGKPGQKTFGKPSSEEDSQFHFDGNSPFEYPAESFNVFEKLETGQIFKPVLQVSHYDTFRILFSNADSGTILVRLGGTGSPMPIVNITEHLHGGPQEIDVHVDSTLAHSLGDRLQIMGFFAGKAQGNPHALRIEPMSVIPVVKESFRKTSPDFPLTRDLPPPDPGKPSTHPGKPFRPSAA
jgi:hypothetical protein